MRDTKTYCDRCGKEIITPHQWMQFKKFKPKKGKVLGELQCYWEPMPHHIKWDLCPNCAKSLDRWMKEGKPDDI